MKKISFVKVDPDFLFSEERERISAFFQNIPEDILFFSPVSNSPSEFFTIMNKIEEEFGISISVYEEFGFVSKDDFNLLKISTDMVNVEDDFLLFAWVNKKEFIFQKSE